MLTEKESRSYQENDEDNSTSIVKEPAVRKKYKKTDGYELGPGRIKIEKEEHKEKLFSKKGLISEEKSGVWNKR